MNKSESIAKLSKALSMFQNEAENPKNSATNPQFKSSYAPLEVVINAVKPILSKHGLSFIQSLGSGEESISVTTLLMHESGEWLESEPLTLPAHQIRKGGGKDYNAQGAGSAITYARRYSLSAMLGINSEDDDDANHASKHTEAVPKVDPITQQQVGILKTKALKFAELRGRTEKEVHAALKISDVTKLSEAQADASISNLDKWLKGAIK